MLGVGRIEDDSNLGGKALSFRTVNEKCGYLTWNEVGRQFWPVRPRTRCPQALLLVPRLPIRVAKAIASLTVG